MSNFDLKRILLHLDADNPSPTARACAIELAKAHQGRIEVVDILPEKTWPATLFDAKVEQAFEKFTHAKARQLRIIADELKDHGVPATTNVLSGPASVALIREVKREGYDLVIRETKGMRSRREGFFGTTSTRLLRNCPCPVLLLKPGHPWNSSKGVVAAVDATTNDDVHAQLNTKILKAADAICCGLKDVDILSAWTPQGHDFLEGYLPDSNFRLIMEESQTFCRQKLDELVNPFGLSISRTNVHVLRGAPSEAILHFVKENNSQLLVMGTVGRSGLSGVLMGNTAEQVFNQLDGSVLALKPDGI